MFDIMLQEVPPPLSLAQRFEAWRSSDVGGDFAAGAEALRNDIVDAMRDDAFDRAGTACAGVAEYFAMEPDLRRRGMLAWPTLRHLGEARMMAACLLAEADRDGALAILRDQTRWCKEVLGSFPFADDGDFEEGLQFIFIAQLSYLIAHRYVRPEDRHIADRGIPEDFARTFGRVFDKPLQDRVTALMDRLAATA